LAIAVRAATLAAAAQPAGAPFHAATPVAVTIVHLNDVCEILPVEGG